MDSIADKTHQVNDSALNLTRQTKSILDYLRARPGQVVTTQEIITHAWQRPFYPSDAKSVWVHMRWLRTALGDTQRPYRIIQTKTLYVDYDKSRGKRINPRGYVYAGEAA